MRVLIPFNDCIARPPEGDKTFPLLDHLLEVKLYMEQSGVEDLLFQQDQILLELMGLAGFCHDIAKADADWQHYIRESGKEEGPPHSAGGAFLFSYLGYELLQAAQSWDNHKHYWLWLIRDIADHHGSLKSIDNELWRRGLSNWERIDLAGVQACVQDYYAGIGHVKISYERLAAWSREVRVYVREVKYALIEWNRNGMVGLLRAMLDLQTWRQLTTALIAGDRFSISYLETQWFDREQALHAASHIDQFCKMNDGLRLAGARIKSQQIAMQQLQMAPDKRMYTLEMPTGYGKTITSLKMALHLCAEKQYEKIVYVAPYLSILEQTSAVIEETMRMHALEHHSLAMIDDQLVGQRTLTSQLMMESWAHQIVCTSFQQFAKALFPQKAQHTLRRSFLKNSVIIIDEPQIFNPGSWNMFLCGLEAMAEKFNLRVIFLSATMPTFEYGLQEQPTRIVIQGQKATERYKIEKMPDMDEKTLATYIVQRDETLQGVIMNTIEDAYHVYEQLSRHTMTELDEQPELHLVHGLMIPLHKKYIIKKIQHHLNHKRHHPLTVVSTQVLEAGVDVSFHHVARALPIMPSIVQAAGRINRHFENSDLGQLTLFKFLRHGEKDTRSPIYDKELQSITETILGERTTWFESEVNELITQYYDMMFHRNPYTANLRAIHEAHQGDWPQLSDYDPFGQDILRLPLFIPWNYDDRDKDLLPEGFLKLKNKFNLRTPEQIYDCYIDRTFWQRRDFELRKQFTILLQHYIVNVPVKVALKYVSREAYLDNSPIPLLEDTTAYDQALGLISHFEETSLII